MLDWTDGLNVHRCRQFQLYHQVYAIMSQGIVAGTSVALRQSRCLSCLLFRAVLLILRTYALYNCSKRMLIVLICMHIGGGVQCLVCDTFGLPSIHSQAY